MKTRARFHALPLIVAILATVAVAAGAASPRGSAIGLLPVYDVSGEGHGSVVAQALGLYLFKRLSAERVPVVLLNPGSGYAPLDDGSYAELADDEGVHHVLVTRIEPGTRHKKDRFDLHATAAVVDVQGHKPLLKVIAETDVKRNDVRRYHEFEGLALFTRSRQFEKEPLGKATSRLVDTLASGIVGALPALIAAAPAVLEGGPECRVTFRIRYPGEAVSKTYSVEVNERDETLGVRDGSVELSLPSGPVTVYAIVRDAPRRLPVQSAYFANTLLDCAAPTRELVLQIGPAGEARVVWQ